MDVAIEKSKINRRKHKMSETRIVKDLIRLSKFCGWIALFAAVVLLLPLSAQAQCNGIWQAAGKWSFKQQNARNPVYLDMMQNGKAIFGTASHSIPGSGNIGASFGVAKTGKVNGTVLGDRLSIEIEWHDGVIGVYNARILPSGRIEGEAYEKYSPNVRHAWNSTLNLPCRPSPPPPIAKSTPSTPAPTPNKSPKPQPALAPMKVPGIIASQVAFPAIHSPTGFANIQWDAGPDHPYAEIWLKVDGGQEQFLVEQGKGGRQITVERGKVYTYILTDAGKTLATVIVVGR